MEDSEVYSQIQENEENVNKEEQEGSIVYQFEQESGQEKSNEAQQSEAPVISKSAKVKEMSQIYEQPKTEVESKQISVMLEQSQKGPQMDEKCIIFRTMAQVLTKRSNLTMEKLVQELKTKFPHIELDQSKYQSFRGNFCYKIIRGLQKYISLSHNIPLKPIESRAIVCLQKTILRCKVELNCIYSKQLLNFIKTLFGLEQIKPNPAVQLPLYKFLSWTAVKNLEDKQQEKLDKIKEEKQKQKQKSKPSREKKGKPLYQSTDQREERLSLKTSRLSDCFGFSNPFGKGDDKINLDSPTKQVSFKSSKSFSGEYDQGLSYQDKKKAYRQRYNQKQLQKQYMFGEKKVRRKTDNIHKVNEAWNKQHEKFLRKTFTENQNFYFIIRKFKDKFPEMRDLWDMKSLKGRFTRTTRAAFRRLRQIISSQSCIDLPQLLKLDQRVYGQIIRSDKASDIQIRLFDLLRDQPLKKSAVGQLIQLINTKQRAYDEKQERIEKMLLGGQKKNVLQHELGVLSDQSETK